MKYQVRTSLPLAETQFNGDDDKKKKKKSKPSPKKDTFTKKNAKEQGFTTLTPAQIKKKKAQILRLEKSNPKKSKTLRDKLMVELKKGYYKG